MKYLDDHIHLYEMRVGHHKEMTDCTLLDIAISQEKHFRNFSYSTEKVPSSILVLKVTYHPLYSMNKFVTNKSKLPQDWAQVSVSLYGVIGYHVTL